MLKFAAVALLAFSASPIFAQNDKPGITTDDVILAYARLEKTPFIGERTSVVTRHCDGKLEVHSTVLTKHGKNGFVTVSTDHLKHDNKTVRAQNGVYGFEMRGTVDDKWTVDLALAQSKLPSYFANSEKSAGLNGLPIVFYQRITDYCHAPSFQVRQIGSEVRDGISLLIVEFSCGHGESEKEGRYTPQIKSGTMELMKDFCLLPVKVTLEAKYPADVSFANVVCGYEYDLSNRQLPLVTKSSKEVHYIAVPDMHLIKLDGEHQYRNIGVEPQQAEFRLPAFGLRELDHLPEIVR